MSSQKYLQKVRGETSSINYLLCRSPTWLIENHPAADAFILRYYRALERQRDTIASLFVLYERLSEKVIVPNIKINGNTVFDGIEMQTRFKNEMPRLKYDLESFDCRVLPQNHPLKIGINSEPTSRNGKHLQLSVTITGTLEIGDSNSIEYRKFSDNFVIVPAPLQRGKSKTLSYDYLIQMQNFRFVV